MTAADAGLNELRPAGPRLPPYSELRSQEPLALLSRQLDAACTGALHPHELAAILESEGFTDALVREKYGDQDVFECAQRLFELVPYRPAAAELAHVTAPPLARDLLRGVIYLLPAVWTPSALALRWPGGEQAITLGLLVATLFGWGWMQGVAYLGYLRLVQGVAASARMLRQASGAALLLTLLAALLLSLWQNQNPMQVSLIAVSIGAYLAAATALLVLGRERELLLASLPALLWVAAQRIWPGLAELGQGQQTAGLLALAVGLPVAAALLATAAPARHPVLRGAGPTLWQPHTWLSDLQDLLRRALPHAVYGWLCAAFLALVLLRPLSEAGGFGGWSWSVVPLVLSMGFLEWCLRRVHTALRRVAESSDTLRRATQRSILELLRYAACYGAALLGAYLLTRAVAPALSLEAPRWPLLLGHVCLGVGLLLSGLLSNFQLLRRVLPCWALAVASQVVLLRLGQAADLAYALSAVLALTLLLSLCISALRDIRHLS